MAQSDPRRPEGVQAPPDLAAATLVAVKAFVRVVEAWGLTATEAAALADVSPRIFARMRAGAWAGALGQDRALRLSALIGLYKGLHLFFSDALADAWVRLPNSGPPFLGNSPAAFMQAGGLAAILATRNYVDALRGGM